MSRFWRERRSHSMMNDFGQLIQHKSIVRFSKLNNKHAKLDSILIIRIGNLPTVRIVAGALKVRGEFLLKLRADEVL